MVNPMKELFFCPMINDNCKRRECIAMEKKTHRWSNEGCMGGETWHSEDYYRCKHYPKVRINLSDSREDIEYQSSASTAKRDQ